MASSSHNRIAICADDFGLSETVNAGIVDLAMHERITAVSVLSEGSATSEHIRELVIQQAQTIDLGLHFNLTESLEKSPKNNTLGYAVAASYFGRLDAWRIREQIHAQLQKFEDWFGQVPDFVDGHQHVHLLPTVRESIVAVLTERYGNIPIWVRCCRSPSLGLRGSLGVRLKTKLLNSMEFFGATRVYSEGGYSRNRRLLGIDNFNQSDRHFDQRLIQWCSACEDGDLLMVHPAILRNPLDKLSQRRPYEYRALKSQQFLAALQSNRLQLSRMSNILFGQVGQRSGLNI